MLSSFVDFEPNQSTDWGENLLNTVASKAIRHLFTRSESVEVKVGCHPSTKLLQGTIDSFQMSGRGLVIRRAFRTQVMSFETDAVAIDFSSLLQGQISLKQPTQAIASVKLSEVDINQAFQAELVTRRLENLCVPEQEELSGGQPVSFTSVELQLLPHNRIKLFANANLANGTVPITMSCTLAVVKRRRIAFQEIQFEPETIPADKRETSQKLTLILGKVLNNMIDLERFDLDGVTMRLNRLETQEKMLVLSGYAQIKSFPRSG